MLEKVLEIGDFRQNKKALKSFKIKEYQGFSVGALQGIRTPDLLVRSQTLYPTELAAHLIAIVYYHNTPKKSTPKPKKF